MSLIWLYVLFAMAGISQRYDRTRIASALALVTVLGLTIWGTGHTVAPAPLRPTGGELVAHHGSTQCHNPNCVIVRDAVSRGDDSLEWLADEREAATKGFNLHFCVKSHRIAQHH